MVATKSVADIAKKYGDVTPGRASYYQEGVKAPKKDWAQNAAAASEAYKAGVARAAQQNMFAGGVKKAGTEKWQRKASTVGVDRYGPGVRAAQEDYGAGIAPFIDEINRVTLPTRKMRGDPANIDRVRTLNEALAKKRLSLRAAG
jgi:predicted aminopeptidase